MIIGAQEETSTLTDEMVMTSTMTTSEFIGLSIVDINFTGYLADCGGYGRDVENGWGLIKDGE